MPITLLDLSDEQLWMANYAVLPAWVLLLLLPQRRFTHRVVVATAGLMALLYVLMMLGLTRDKRPSFSTSEFATLAGVHRLLSDKSNVLIAWTHYLAFDVLVGKWIVDDNRKYGLSQLLIAPCLVFCLLLGPSGLLMYLLLRTVCSSKAKVK